jgi:hypothetical protein
MKIASDDYSKNATNSKVVAFLVAASPPAFEVNRQLARYWPPFAVSVAPVMTTARTRPTQRWSRF